MCTRTRDDRVECVAHTIGKILPFPRSPKNGWKEKETDFSGVSVWDRAAAQHREMRLIDFVVCQCGLVTR